MAKRHSIRFSLAALSVAALLMVVFPEPASSTVGDLTFVACVADTGLSGCADPPLDALANARIVAVSPDGTSVYVTANFYGALIHFTRAPDGTPSGAASPRTGTRGAPTRPRIPWTAPTRSRSAPTARACT